METILKTGYNKILKLFYNDKNAEIHLRDLARKTGLNENGVSRYLNQLEHNSILKSKKDGNLKKYYINKNNFVFLLFSIFDIEKYEKLPSVRKDALMYFLDKLKKKPIIAIIFGSTAKHTFNKESDLDLLLIVNEKINVDNAEEFSESQTGIKINCFQINYSQFKEELKLKKDRVIQSAINSGYPVTNHILFYREVIS